MKGETVLRDLDVLVLDIQATGANPVNGDVLELGWMFTKCSGDSEHVESVNVDSERIECYLLKLPEESEIPRRVSRITGIKKEDTENGYEPADAWKILIEKVKEHRGIDVYVGCPTIIHFSGYEEPFLRHLHGEFTPDEPFYFDIICTHRLVKRLFPELPRKGLRAAAGYLGYSVPEFRRSEDHVAASAFIWHQLVEKLKEIDISTLSQLKEFLNTPAIKVSVKSSGTERQYPMEKSKRSGLPKEPGVYRMLRVNGDLLYIGKATSLRHRVNSYFHKKKKSGHAEHTLEMLSQAVDLEVTVTGSALEAALLETDEIKRHSPPYNIALRERERKTGFFSRDFSEATSTPDINHPVGPLPAREVMVALGEIEKMVSNDWTVPQEPGTPEKLLGVLPEFAPDLECFLDGLVIFRERHGDFLESYRDKRIHHGLMALGKESRRRKLEEAALAKKAAKQAEEIEEDEEPAEKTEWVWTPEAVASALEGIVRFASLLIRRARWFCILSESTLTWITGKTSGQQPRLIVIQSGDIVHRETVETTQSPPIPPGCQKSFSKRQQSFDLITYDRMRVLTTEIRRLISDDTDRKVQLRLNPKVVLNAKSLNKLLQWL